MGNENLKMLLIEAKKNFDGNLMKNFNLIEEILNFNPQTAIFVSRSWKTIWNRIMSHEFLVTNRARILGI